MSEEKEVASSSANSCESSGGGGGGRESDLGSKKRGLSHRRGSSLNKTGHRTSSLLVLQPGEGEEALPTPTTTTTEGVDALLASVVDEHVADQQQHANGENTALNTSSESNNNQLNDSALSSNSKTANGSMTSSTAARLGQLFSHFRGSDAATTMNQHPTPTGGGRGHARTGSSLPSLDSVHRIVRVFSEEDKKWELRRTLTGGVHYYLHTGTGQVQLEPKPDALKTLEEWEAEDNGEASTWIPHPTLVWQPAKIVKRSQQTGEVTVKPAWAGGTAKLVTIPANRVWKETGNHAQSQVLQLWPLKEHVLEGDAAADVDDVVALEHPNEAMLLHTLRERFVLWKKIYTWVGASRSVLISINPFQPLPELYSDAALEEQRSSDTEHSLSSKPPPPHVFGLCKGALELCLFDQQNCSVLISGESGAGKTEATKYCLKFLSADSGQDSTAQLESKLMNANLLLEEFGNARTNRNANSSRFGKWIQLSYDLKTRKLCHSRLTTFLLERTRVIFQAKGEANYHIFNLVLANEYLRAEHGLGGSTGDFRYISNSASASSRSESDFKRILLSLTEIGLEAHEQECVFQIIAAILHLGQLDVEQQSGSGSGSSGGLRISTAGKRAKTEHRGNTTSSAVGKLWGSSHHRPVAAQAAPVEPAAAEAATGSADEGAFHLAETCRLLGLEVPAEFERAVCFRTVEVRGEKSTIALSLSDARNSLDSLAMQLYGRLFDQLLLRINTTLSHGLATVKPKKQAWIGLLDIFGFEIFEKNSFEQLCINFCNERLQSQFNLTTFGEEEGLYRFEEIEFAPIKFRDNASMVQFVEGKGTGLFAMLDDEVRGVGGANDTKFVNRLVKEHDKNPILVKQHAGGMASGLRSRVMGGETTSSSFTVAHYAGNVKYDAQGFVQANVEQFRNEMHLVMRTSTKHFISKELFPALPEEADGKVRQAKKQTVSGVFRQQLADLMGEIQGTESRYIRCIKPNAQCQPAQVDSVLVMEQLRYSGIFETVDIRRVGYPFRKTHVQFAYQFQCLHPPSAYVKSRDDDYKGRCEEILQNLPGGASSALSLHSGDVQIGKTRVLYRTKQHHLLVLLRNLALEQRIVPWIQARLRGFIARQTLRLCLEADELVKDSLEDDTEVDRMEDALLDAEEVVGERAFRLFPAIRLPHQAALERKMATTRQWLAAEEEMEQLLETDEREVEAKFYDLRSLLKKVDALPSGEGVYEPTRRQDRLVDQLRDLVSNCTMQQQEKRFQEIQDQASDALLKLDRARMLAVKANFAQDADIYQPGVQVFVAIDKKLEEMADKERNLQLAVDVLHRERMEQCLKETRELKLTSAGMDECARLLALSAHEFCRLELQVAQRAGDDRRRIHREIFLWEHDQQQKSPQQAVFEALPYWRQADEWVNKAKMFTRLFRRERVERGFKAYTKTPVHFPVTYFGVPPPAAAPASAPSSSRRGLARKSTLSVGGDHAHANEHDTPERRKQAVLVSKLLLPVFLPSAATASTTDDVDAGVREVLQMAMQDAPMRVEIVVQILRMLHGNTDEDSVRRGEQLLGMLLLTVPLSAAATTPATAPATAADDLEQWLLGWLKRRFAASSSSAGRLQKYWAAVENVRYSQLNKVFNKSMSQLRQEWDALTISHHALQPGQSSGPSDPSQLAPM